MTILVAPDSFKGTYTAAKIISAILRRPQNVPGYAVVDR